VPLRTTQNVEIRDIAQCT